MIFYNLVEELLFLWMAVGMGIWLINYQAIKNSYKNDKE